MSDESPKSTALAHERKLAKKGSVSERTPKPFYRAMNREHFLELAKTYRLGVFGREQVEKLDEPLKSCIVMFEAGVASIAHEVPKNVGGLLLGIARVNEKLGPYLDESEKVASSNLHSEVREMLNDIKFGDQYKARPKLSLQLFLEDFKIDTSVDLVKENFYKAGQEAGLRDIPERFLAFSEKYRLFYDAVETKNNHQIGFDEVIKYKPNLNALVNFFRTTTD